MNKLLLLSLLVLPALARAETYKWVDDQGQAHFSQEVPKVDKYEIVPDPAPPPPASTSAIHDYVSKQDKARAEASAAAAKAEQDAAADRDRCVQARGVRQMLSDSGGRVKVQNQNGEFERANDEQFQQKVAEADRAITQFCH